MSSVAEAAYARACDDGSAMCVCFVAAKCNLKKNRLIMAGYELFARCIAKINSFPYIAMKARSC